MLPVSTYVHMLDEDDFGKPLPNLSPLFQSSTADLILSSCDSCHVSLFPRLHADDTNLHYHRLNYLVLS